MIEEKPKEEVKEKVKDESQTVYLSRTRKKTVKEGFVRKKPKAPIEFPSYDIPKEKLFAVLESEDINELRVEVETQNKVKAMEMKKKLKAHIKQKVTNQFILFQVIQVKILLFLLLR